MDSQDPPAQRQAPSRPTARDPAAAATPATCPSRIRCQTATGSWTKSRQWETQRTLFSSARATMWPPAKVDGVWPFNDAWLRTSLSEARRQAPRNVASSLDSARELGIRDAQVIQAPADAAHHLASPGDVHSPVAGAARLASLGDRPRVADAAVHGRGLVATLGIEPAAYGPVGAHPALRVAAPGGFVARRHQAAGPVSARRPSHSRQPAPRIAGCRVGIRARRRG